MSDKRLHLAANTDAEFHGNGHEFAITNDQQDLIVSLVGAGFSIRSALARACVPIQTYEDWMRKGGDIFSTSRYRVPLHQAVEPYKTFAMRVRSARAEAEMAASIRVMDSKDWRAHAWYMERQFPETWGAKSESKSQANADANDTPNHVKLYIPDNGRKLEDGD